MSGWGGWKLEGGVSLTGPRGVAPARLQCPAGCGHARLEQMLRSRERTVRFTGCKLARLKHDAGLIDAIRELAGDPEEDAYVRMEAAVALAETRTPTAFNLLRLVLEDQQQPLFLRSACAWGIGCHRTKEGAECLVRAFGDVAPEIREEALVALEDLGSAGLDSLLKGLSEESSDVAAGAAEALRRIRAVPVRDIAALAERSDSTWPAWTLAHLPKDAVTPYITALQNKRPDVHYAVSVLWTFLDSWIAADWTPGSKP